MIIDSEARERVLNVAEHLFSERGYAAVTLRQIADALGIKQASLYYHVPGGKQALFVEVTERGLTRHQRGLEQAIAAAAEATADKSAAAQMDAQLNAAVKWLLSQPPLNLSRMSVSDMPALEPEVAERLGRIAYESLMLPLASVFAQAAGTGELRAEAIIIAPELLAGTLLSAVESMHTLRDEYFPDDALRETQAARLIDVFIHGLVR